MSTPAVATQSPAERKAAEVELRELVQKHAGSQAKLFDAVRQWVVKRVPTAYELVYEYRTWIVVSYSPNENGYDGVLAVRADADEVKLYLNAGKSVPDPDKLLKGSGTMARYIPLDGASTLKRPEVGQLVDEAIARAAKLFPRKGTGPIVIRSQAAKASKRKSAS